MADLRMTQLGTERCRRSELNYGMLIRACREGDVPTIERLMALQPKIYDARSPAEYVRKSPQYYACKHGQIEALRLLTEKFECNPCCVSNRDHTLMHMACVRGHLEIVRYLGGLACRTNTLEFHLRSNKEGTTPLFGACYGGQLSTLRYLIDDLGCDPKAVGKAGDTLLHIAAQTGNVDITRALTEMYELNPRVFNDEGNSPLHYATENGHLEMVKHLTSVLSCDKDALNGLGYTPLHIATQNGHRDIVEYLIDEQHCSPYQEALNGFTPLYLSCKHNQKDVTAYLLSKNVNPNYGGTVEAPIAIAKDKDIIKLLIRHGAEITHVLDLLRPYIEKNPLDPVVHIYVIGHWSSGKSTLAAALMKSQQNGIRQMIRNVVGRPTTLGEVEPQTAGIIPMEFENQDFGKVLLFDFAGQMEYHASHAAILEHANTASAPLFLLVINLTESFVEIQKKIQYWVSFIRNHRAQHSPHQPHVVVIGSHRDQLRAAARSLETALSTELLIRTYAENYLRSSQLQMDGFFAIDCRDPAKHGELRHCLKDCCRKLRRPTNIHKCCHVLSILLAKSFKDEQLSCTIKDVRRIAEEKDYPLPLRADRLCELAQELSTRMSILFLKNMTDLEKSWIVLDIDKLLHVINGRIFAPTGFKERCLKSSITGILPFSQLRERFQDINVKPNLVVAFLGHLEFCKAIKDPEVLRLIDGKSSHSPNHRSAATNGITDDSITESDTVHPSHHCHFEPKPPQTRDVSRGYVLIGSDTTVCTDGTGSTETRKKSLDPRKNPSLIQSLPTTSRLSPPCTAISSNRRSKSESEVSKRDKPSQFGSTGSIRFPKSSNDSTKSHTFPLTNKGPSCSHGRRASDFSHGFDETFFFFPGLISATKPKDKIWHEDKSFTSYFGWCLLPDQYFTARFLELIFLRLTVKFAITNLTGSPNLSQECTIWKNGLRWLSNYGIETLVEKVEEGIVLLMRAKEGAELKAVALRSAIIKKILDTKKKYCDANATEYVLPVSDYMKSSYPVIRQAIHTLPKVSIDEIVHVFCDQEMKYAKVVGENPQHSLVSIKELMYFDPYMNFGEARLQEIYCRSKQHSDLKQNHTLLYSIAQSYPEHSREFGQILLQSNFLSPSHARCRIHGDCTCQPPLAPLPEAQTILVLERYVESAPLVSLEDFRKRLDSYSIFAGRDILNLRRLRKPSPVHIPVFDADDEFCHLSEP